MKKVLAIAMALALSLSLTACFGGEENSSSSSSSSEPSSSSMPSSSMPSSSTPSSSSSSMPSSAPTMSTDFTQIGALESKAVLWGPGYNVDDANRPTACIDLQAAYGKYEGHFLAPNQDNMYLTFDEGYENGHTSAILDVLKEKNVSAVFFVTLPYVKAEPELVQRMIDEGHIVGNHSCKHPDFTTITLEEAYQEVKGLHDYMLENFDYTMSLFRYPTGAFNEQTLAMLHDMGYKTVFWSFAYADWDPAKQPDPAAAMKRVTEAAHPGAIYLLHAVSQVNAELLGDFIDSFRAQGYTLAPYDVTTAAE